jgi:hypothetical protein
MFSIIGKIWSVDKVPYGDGFFMRLILKKKKHDNEFLLSMVIFKKEIIDQYEKRQFSSGDTVKIDFHISAKQFSENYYNNIYVQKIVVKKRNGNSVLNIFDTRNSRLSDFEI